MAVVIDLLRVLTDEELRDLSERNPGYQFERTADGRLVVSPTGSESERRSFEVAYQLRRWNERVGTGVVFGSSAGFKLLDGGLVSPDACWVLRARWEALSRQEREGFAPLCPDAVFEVRSLFQSRRELSEKMQVYLRNGARIAVLIDPYARTVEVYRPAREVEVYQDPERIALDPELPGFELDLRPVFEA